MTRKKTTKRTLVMSVLSLVLCASMFIGSTFAWFTDTDTTAVSNIVSGTLDIEIVDTAGKEKTTPLAFKNVNGETAILWEPNVTFETEQFALKNVGNLWLKYKVVINNTEISYAKLNEVIDFYLVDAAGAKIDLATMQDVELEPNATSGYMHLEAHMKESAGNAYQDLTLSGVSITVLATQYTKEVDMTNDQYDATAKYPEIATAATQEDLNSAIASATGSTTTVALSNGTYKMPTLNGINNPNNSKEITFTGTKDTVIDASAGANAADSSVAFEGVTVGFDETTNYRGLTHADKVVYKDCVINGQQTMYAPQVEFINCTFVNQTGYNVWTYGAEDVTFTNCTFITGGRAILVYNEVVDGNFVANVTLNNCTFKDNGTYKDPKAAVETGSNANNTATSNKYNITFNDCKIEGFETNNSTSALWGNKNSMDQNHLNVVIDGVDVY